jgi:hypothetical protein
MVRSFSLSYGEGTTPVAHRCMRKGRCILTGLRAMRDLFYKLVLIVALLTTGKDSVGHPDAS